MGTGVKTSARQLRYRMKPEVQEREKKRAAEQYEVNRQYGVYRKLRAVQEDLRYQRVSFDLHTRKAARAERRMLQDVKVIAKLKEQWNNERPRKSHRPRVMGASQSA